MKKRLIPIAIGVLCAAMLSACGDGTDGADKGGSGPVQEVTSKPIMSDEERKLADYENKYSTGDFTAEDYKGLAEIYGQQGYFKKQRDLMEQGYRLYSETEIFNTLQGIVVNVAEEDASIQEEIQRLMQNISIPEYRNEAVGMLCSQDWLAVTMPKMKQGHRNYYLQNLDSNETLFLKAGYDENGNGFSTVWYLEGENILVLLQKAGTIQMVETGLADGQYQGAFDSWLCAAQTGDVYHESGTFEAGRYSGGYTSQVHFGTEAVDLFALWSTRESMEFSAYTGDFGEDGTAKAEQPSGSEKKTVHGGNEEDAEIVYAYDEEKKNYLFLNVPEGTEVSSYVFESSVLGLESYPAFTAYEPKAPEAISEGQEERQISTSDVKVRIYDSNIEWFDGVKWHTAGTVEELASQDPFKDLTGAGQIPAEGGESGGAGQESAYARRGGGTIQKGQSNAPSNTKPTQNKPANNTKPGNTQKPVTPPATQPPADPAPSTPPDDGGNSGGGDSGGNDGGNSGGDNGGGNNGGDGGGNDGGDVDIEWTPDIL